jgi:hypothetical protein
MLAKLPRDYASTLDRERKCEIRHYFFLLLGALWLAPSMRAPDLSTERARSLRPAARRCVHRGRQCHRGALGESLSPVVSLFGWQIEHQFPTGEKNLPTPIIESLAQSVVSNKDDLCRV